MGTAEDWVAWLRLLELPGLGRESARKLLAAFGSPQAVLDAGTAARQAVVGPVTAALPEKPPPDIDERIAATRRWLREAPPESPRRLIALGDPLYPAALLEMADPPLLLHAQGRVDLLAAPGLAIVGSRQATPQGLENARAFGEALSDAGLTIVSGLAQGIDGAAHEGGLQGRSASIAVVGTGLDQVYPKRHADLAGRLSVQGLVLSEYSLGTPPLAENFPQRNRLIAGLSRGTLVVEAALQSGSLISARLASEAGREVFAIPGSIHSPQSRGCHWLIKQGAKLVECAQDVLDELQWAVAAKVADVSDDSSADPQDAILAALGHEPTSLDALVARTGWSAAQLNIRLLELELDGRVARLPGQLFQRVSIA